MDTEELVGFVLGVAVPGVLIIVGTAWIHSLYLLRKKRLDVLDKALGRDDLDPETRRGLVETLAREQRDEPRPFFTNRDWWRRASFGVGWVLFLLFGGLQLLAVTGIVFVPVYPFTAPLALLGLGLMTLPVALRDLGRRALAD